MNIIIATVQVPFVRGGAEVLAEMLQATLRGRGHRVDIVTLPFKWYPAERLLESMVAGRLLDLTEVNGQKVDVLIGLKFPAYYAPHPNKVIWLLHQHRQAYDLWRSRFGDIDQWPEAEWVRQSIIEADTKLLAEARGIYTISQNVSDRLYKYNGLKSRALYHPPAHYEQMACRGWEPYIFYPSRITEIKRQRLLVEAAAHLKTNASIVLAGVADGGEQGLEPLREIIRRHGLKDRVRFEGFITDERKIELLSRCSAVYFGGYDEDYGYVTLEAMFSGKPVLTLSDCGGALEFVRDGHNGYIVDADPRALAERIDRIVTDASLARRMGASGRETMREKGVSWDSVIDALLESARG